MNVNQKLVYVIYDGIENSVFQSQVLEPLLRKLDADPALQADLISFEARGVDRKKMADKVPMHPRLSLHIGWKLPFFGRLSLRPALWQLKKIIKMTKPTELLARGPLAGWLALRARSSSVPVTIQARGLCAEEYRYVCAHLPPTGLRGLLSPLVQHELHSLEYEVYGQHRVPAEPMLGDLAALDFLKDKSSPSEMRKHFLSRGALTLRKKCIESVSPALSDFLIKTFGADPSSIKLAADDLTPLLSIAEREAARLALRGQLGIPADAPVYVYSGSFKAWQCADETVTHAANLLREDLKAHFMVLSRDRDAFAQAARSAQIDPARLHVMAVSSAELTRYLAVADFGFLLRQPDVINWVSRPTKMLEYHAAGLTIIHNGTVGVLAGGSSVSKL